MNKAFWIYQISNLLSLVFFSVIVINYVYPETLIWIRTYIYLYFGAIIFVIYSKKWATKFDPNSDNPISTILICKYLQYIGIGAFIVFAILKIVGVDDLLKIGGIFSISCMVLAYILTFVLKPKKVIDTSLLDDIEFE